MTTPELKEYNRNEKKFYDALHGHLQACHVQRIETTTGPGVPDVNICRGGIECWLELKMVLLQGVLVRKEQFAWHTQRAFRGGRCFVVAKVKDMQEFKVWRAPYKVEVYNPKYLRIVSKPEEFSSYNDLINFLFTSGI